VDTVDALVLKKIKGVGDETLLSILKFMSANQLTSLEDLEKINLSLLPVKKVPSALKAFLGASQFDDARKETNEELLSWGQNGIQVFSYCSSRYPSQLLDLDKPPPFLFCKGNFGLLDEPEAIAVVGTRKNSKRGELITRKTVEAFGDFGFTIVSGLALGIDSIAHKQALASNAPTIAVLVDLFSISPSSNRDLAQKILDNGGLWVAENQPGTRAIPAFFAKRDRIQAGLSTAVFAIETTVDGGTMHAVNSAHSMSRPVFVPNPEAAGYKDLSAPEISGTQALVQDKKATYYTRESYKDINNTLKKRAYSFREEVKGKRLL
jgi:DNA processing protein